MHHVIDSFFFRKELQQHLSFSNNWKCCHII